MYKWSDCFKRGRETFKVLEVMKGKIRRDEVILKTNDSYYLLYPGLKAQNIKYEKHQFYFLTALSSFSKFFFSDSNHEFGYRTIL